MGVGEPLIVGETRIEDGRLKIVGMGKAGAPQSSAFHSLSSPVGRGKVIGYPLSVVRKAINLLRSRKPFTNNQ